MLSERGLTDASFFSLAHHVLHAHRSAIADPNQADRHRYTCLQCVAPFVDGRMPESSQFKQVRCHDLSLTGFSYLSDEPPGCEQVIVALGSGPFILVSARVVHHSPTFVEGTKSNIVGCQFVARIEAGGVGPFATATPLDVSGPAAPNHPR